MVHQNIINLIPTIQAAQLVGHNLKVVKKKDTGLKDILGLGVTNIVGTEFIKLQAQLGNL